MPFLIGRLPYVHEADGGVEAVEHGQWQSEMAEHGPEQAAVELGAIVSTHGLTLDLECLCDPHGHVADNEEGDELTAWLLQSQSSGVTATPQSVDDERRLEKYLDDL